MRKLAWVVCAAMTMGLPAVAQQTEWNPETAAATTAPEHPITVDQVHEMMRLTGAMNLGKEAMQGIMPLLRQAMPPYIPADVMDDMSRSMLGANLEAPLIHSYQAHLSTEDAAAIIAFYKTPAGQRLLATMPQIMKECQQAGAQLGQKIAAEVLERHHAEIEAAKEKYEQQHAGTAPNN